MSDIDFASYADGNIPYLSADNIKDVIKKLDIDSIKLFNWFSKNQMKVNKDKCHLILSNNEHESIKLDDTEIENSNREKLLGIKIDSKLNFKEHLDGIIKKARRKVNALSWVAHHMSVAKGYLCFPAPCPGPGPGLSPRPQFVFDGPGPNLYLAAPVLKLYLPALAS